MHAILAILAAFSTSASALTNFTVVTDNGEVIGHQAVIRPAVVEFLGIPYAQPPVGNLRFAPPLKSGPFTVQPFVASSYGFDCPQSVAKPVDFPRKTPQFQRVLNNFNDVLGNTQSEDCLTLNIWSKSSDRTNKPVLVYFYGGRFNTGSSHTNYTDGQYLADAQDVVVVTINFRINIFGFPGIPGESQNLGLQDQRLAVEWVRDNIAAFSGDPSRISIAGQSSGSVAVSYWPYAYVEDPIVAGIISHSGVPFSFPINSPELATHNWYNVSAILGCGDSGDTLPCMRSKNFTDISTAAAQVPSPPGSSKERAQPPFQPTDDNITVFGDYFSRSANGDFARIPYLLGNCNNEGGFYKVSAFALGNILNQSAWNNFNRQDFTCAVALEAGNRVKNNVPAWRFRYFGDWDNLRLYPGGPLNGSGAYHGSDVEMLFGATEDVSGLPNSAAEQKTISLVQNAWATFLEDPSEGLEKFGWPKYGSQANSLILLALGNEPKARFVTPNVTDSKCAQYIPGYEMM